MKQILLFGAAFLLTVTATFAQGHRPHKERAHTPEERVEKHLSRLTEALDLTADQQTTIKAQMLENHQAREAALETTGKREERREIREKYRKLGKEKLQSVLTPEQFEQLKALKEERKLDRKERRACRKKCEKEAKG